MRYLLTGGAGFLGNALASRLLQDAHEVSVLDHFTRHPPDPRLSQAFRGDVRSLPDAERAVRGCDAVIHLAYPQGRTAEPTAMLDTAAVGTSNILHACQKAGVRELMLVSSPEAYQIPQDHYHPVPETVPLTIPDPLDPRYFYGAGKLISEIMCIAWAQAGHLDRLIIARPHNCYGPGGGSTHVIPQFCLRMNDLIEQYPEGVIPFHVKGTGWETRSYCYIDDCVDQLSLLLSKAGPLGIYNVGTDDERTVRDVAKAVAECYGRDVGVIPETLVARGTPLARIPDLKKIRSLGETVHTSFEEGLKITVEWYRGHN